MSYRKIIHVNQLPVTQLRAVLDHFMESSEVQQKLNQELLNRAFEAKSLEDCQKVLQQWADMNNEVAMASFEEIQSVLSSVDDSGAAVN